MVVLLDLLLECQLLLVHVEPLAANLHLLLFLLFFQG